MTLREPLESLDRLMKQLNSENSQLDVSFVDEATRLLLEKRCLSSSDCLVRRLSLAMCEGVCLRMIVNASCGRDAPTVKRYEAFAREVLADVSSPSSPQQRRLPCAGQFRFALSRRRRRREVYVIGHGGGSRLGQPLGRMTFRWSRRRVPMGYAILGHAEDA